MWEVRFSHLLLFIILPCVALQEVEFNARVSAATGVVTSPKAFIFARENLALHKGMQKLLKSSDSNCGTLRTWSNYEQLHCFIQEWMA